MKPRRSALFMPVTRERAVQKATGLAVDIVVLDLEDSVLPEKKPEARSLISQRVSSYDFGYREVLVRINDAATEWWREDLAAIPATGVDGVVLPKCEDAAAVKDVLAEVAVHAAANLQVWIMLETPLSIINAHALCSLGSPVTGVIVGTADLSKAMRIDGDAQRTGLLTALSQAVLAARASGLTVLDGVFMNVHDSAGLQAECQQGKQLGFDGKTLIHPAQLDVTNTVFSPTETEISDAVALIEAFEVSQRKGEGVCLHKNRLVEALHVEQARELVQFNRQIIERRGQQAGTL